MDEFKEYIEEEIEEEVDEIIVDDLQAERTINKIREIEMEYERLIDVCEQQISRYKGKIEIYKEQMADKTRFYYWRLKDFFNSRENKRATKTQVTYRLPSGTIKMKYGGTKVDYKEAELLNWLKDNGYDEYIKQVQKEGVKWTDLKEKLAFVGESAIIGEDGVVIEGVTVKEVPDKIEFKLTEN